MQSEERSVQPFWAVGEGQGAHVRASRARSGALGSPRSAPRGVRGGSPTEMKGQNTVFVCQSCGAQSRKWLGRCSECDEWNSLVEERSSSAHGRSDARSALTGEGARLYADIESSDAERISSGVSELDRVLGGGMVPGSLVLLGGEPGIGKTRVAQELAGAAESQGMRVFWGRCYEGLGAAHSGIRPTS